MRRKRRACYAADRTGHAILQTLFQQCIKHDVAFYDEYQVVDLAMAHDLAELEVESGGLRVRVVRRHAPAAVAPLSAAAPAASITADVCR